MSYFYYPKFGKYIKQARKNAGYKNQDSVAEKLGVTKETISNWERGGTRPEDNILPFVLDLYNLNWEEYAIAYFSDLNLDSKAETQSEIRDDFPDFLFTDDVLWTMGNLQFNAEEIELIQHLGLCNNNDWLLENGHSLNKMVLNNLNRDYIAEKGIYRIVQLAENILNKFKGKSYEYKYNEILERFVINNILYQDFSLKNGYSVFEENDVDLVELSKSFLYWYKRDYKIHSCYEYVPQFHHILYAIDKIENDLFLTYTMEKDLKIFNPFKPEKIDDKGNLVWYPNNEMHEYMSSSEYIGSSEIFQNWVMVDHETKIDKNGDEMIDWKQSAKLTAKGKRLAEFCKIYFSEWADENERHEFIMKEVR